MKLSYTPPIRRLLSCTVAFLVAITTLTMSNDARAATVSAPQAAPELSDLAQRYLQYRADRLASESSAAQGITAVEIGDRFAGKLASEISAIDARRDLLRKVNGGHKRAEVTISGVEETTLHGGTIELKATEHAKLHFARTYPDAPTFEEYSLRHRFVFERRGNRWVLQETSPELAVGELAPDTQPTIAVDMPTTSAVSPNKDASATDRPTNHSTAAAPDKTKATRNATLAVYDYTAMLDYANKYWNNYNSNYRTYDGVGGDCTNFISQIVKAGGWAEVGSYPGDSRSDNANWYYGSLTITTSYTWPAAENWYWFAQIESKRTSHLDNIWKMLTADVLQVDFFKTGTLSHSIFVTGRSGSGVYADELYLTYHSNNTHNKPLSSFLASNSDAWYYAHRT